MNRLEADHSWPSHNTNSSQSDAFQPVLDRNRTNIYGSFVCFYLYVIFFADTNVYTNSPQKAKNALQKLRKHTKTHPSTYPLLSLQILSL